MKIHIKNIDGYRDKDIEHMISVRNLSLYVLWVWMMMKKFIMILYLTH